VVAHMDRAAIGKLLDPAAYTGLCAKMARDAARRGREVASTLAP
jgi:3-carboxy-cis,cis-muconate cycloisomerase